MEMSATYIVTNIASLCVLLLTCIGNSTKKVKISFSIVTIILILWINAVFFAHALSNSNEDITIFLIRLGDSLALLGAIAIFNFYNTFPQKKISIPLALKVIVGISAFVTILITICTEHVETITITNGEITGALLGKAYPLFITQFVIISVAAIVLAFKNKQLTNKKRRQHKTTLYGLISMLFAATLTNAILPMFSVFIFQKESIIFSLFFLIPTFYCIHKYRLLNISSRSLNQLKHFIMFAALVSVTVFTNGYISSKFLNINTNAAISISIILSLCVCTIIYKILPNFESQNSVYLSKCLKELETTLYRTNNYKNLELELEKALTINMNIQHIELKALSNNYKDTDIKTIELPTEYIGKITRKKYLSHYNLTTLKTSNTISPETDILFGLVFGNQLLGVLCVGKKETLEEWSADEIDILYKFTKAITIPFSNIIFKSIQSENILLKKIVQQNLKKLSSQYKSLLEISKQQKDFISAVAHEFRTPITIALLCVEEITFNNKSHEGYKTARKALLNLKKLSENFFNINKHNIKNIFQPKIPENTKALIDEFTENIFKSNKKANNIQINIQHKITDTQRFICDKSAINQLLHNLLNNALNFAKSKISITFSQTPSSLLIKFSNDGPSIPPSQKQKIFSLFYSPDAQSTGIGMGLYLCQQITAYHKGRIEVLENEDGTDGASFLVTLPWGS